MTHTSIKLDAPIEFVNVEPVNPLISKVQIKVCYVGQNPNRNNTVITKEVANEMAASLPGSPIVGFYNKDKQDFEGHNRELVVDEDTYYFKDTTKPYGFVDLNAHVWFQKFLDDGIEHEYLMTEGYLWTGQYPEANRIIEHGNNQSMELDENSVHGSWAKDQNGVPEFFVINEAVISKLCILGEDVEPCFEGATIAKMQFSFNEGFKQEWFSMMEQMKKMLQEGGPSVEEIKDVSLEAQNEETPAMEFEAEAEAVVEAEAEEVVAEVSAEEEIPAEEPAELEEKTVAYNLEDVVEYAELSTKFAALEAEFASLKEQYDAVTATNAELLTFKHGVERKEKESMIASFYMLSDEEKAEVAANIDNYSLEEIEAKLSVICVRNKVSFNLDETVSTAPTVYSVDAEEEDDTVPAWLKAVQSVAKNMK